MSKKTNKTEHVLKLITKDEELLESLTAEKDEDIPAESDTEVVSKEEKTGETKKTDTADEKRIFLINLTEKIVTEKVEEVMEKLNVCDCPICKNDVLALALNSLEHRYVTTDEGRQYSQLEIYKKQYETDILAALTKACVRVKSSCKHEL